jgi:hypothetical protein
VDATNDKYEYFLFDWPYADTLYVTVAYLSNNFAYQMLVLAEKDITEDNLNQDFDILVSLLHC